MSVNGRVVSRPGTRVSDEDRILVEGRELPARKASLYLALNKPRGYVCSRVATQKFPSFLDLLPKSHRAVHHVGRLDVASEGLLLASDDGAFTHQVCHPSYEVAKEYEVALRGAFPDRFRARARKGILSDGQRLRFSDLEILGRDRVRVVLIGGKNREIRRMMASFQLHVIRIRRLAVGPVRLGDLAVGDWRSLREEELRDLRSRASSSGT